jgi:YfiH family protein
MALVSALLSGRSHAFTGVADGDFRPPAAEAGPALVARLGGVGALRVVTQVHGPRVVHVRDAGPGTEADAIVSDEPGVVVAVRVADCVPILLAAPGAVAAVHAGWRGTAADIARAALDALCVLSGAAPSEVCAAVGPAICGTCYEVGEEVYAGVSAVMPPGRPLPRPPGPLRVDLRAANAAILAELGARVELVGGCTRCGDGLWSHRRDGAAGGRQVGAIRL